MFARLALLADPRSRLGRALGPDIANVTLLVSSSSTTSPIQHRVKMNETRRSKYPMMSMPNAIIELQRTIDAVVGKTSQLVAVGDAVGAVLNDDVVAPCNVPTRPCSRLDGYAGIAADGPGVYPVVRFNRAGHVGSADANSSQRLSGVEASAPSGTGTAPHIALRSGQLAYITTGAPLPPGADAIVKVEDTEAVDAADVPAETLASASAAGFAPSQAAQWVRVLTRVPVGEGVRPAGSDVKAGETLLPSGHELSAVDVGSLLLARVSSVRVYRRPVVGIMSSGDEIVQPPPLPSGNGDRQVDSALADGNSNGGGGGVDVDDRVWDSNKPMLSALISACGCIPLDCGTIPDSGGLDGTAAALLDAIDKGTAHGTAAGTTQSSAHSSSNAGNRRVDVLITTGGVSMGDRDFIKPAIERIGEVVFGRLAMKPGKPTTFGLIRGGAGGGSIGAADAAHDAASATSAAAVPVFALPGNPVSAAVCFHILVAPALRRLRGVPSWPQCHPASIPSVVTMNPIQLDPERPEYHRAIAWIEVASAAQLSASPSSPSASAVVVKARSTGAQASSRLQSLSKANVLLWVPARSGVLPTGSVLTGHLIGQLYSEAALPPEITRGPAASRPVTACGCGHSHGDAGAAHDGDASSGVTDGGLPAAPGLDGDGSGVASARSHPPHVIQGLEPHSASVSSSTGATGNHGSSACQSKQQQQQRARVPVSVCILTVSDSCSRGEVDDRGGPFITTSLSTMCPGLDPTVIGSAIVPDDVHAIQRQILEWTDGVVSRSSNAKPSAAGYGTGTALDGAADDSSSGGVTSGSLSNFLRSAVSNATRALASTSALVADDDGDADGDGAAGGSGGGGSGDGGADSGSSGLSLSLDSFLAGIATAAGASVATPAATTDTASPSLPPHPSTSLADVHLSASSSSPSSPSSTSASTQQPARGSQATPAPAHIAAPAGPPDLIITTGGTGFGIRDVTPEATIPLLHKQAPGLVHAMLNTGLSHTPMAALSRYAAGTRHRTLIINVPGSVKAVRECLEAVAMVLPHAISLVRGD